MDHKIVAHLIRAQELLNHSVRTGDAMQHMKRAEMAFGAKKRKKKIYTTPPKRKNNKRLECSPRNQSKQLSASDTEPEPSKQISETPRPRRQSTNYTVKVEDTKDHKKIAQTMTPNDLYLPQLYVKQSNIPRAGEGVFIDKELDGGVIVAVYTGKLSPKGSKKCETHRMGGSRDGEQCVEGGAHDLAPYMNELPVDASGNVLYNAPLIPHCYLRHVLVELSSDEDLVVEIPVIISRKLQKGEKYVATKGDELFTEYGRSFTREWNKPNTVPQDLRTENDDKFQAMFKKFCQKLNITPEAVGLNYGTLSSQNHLSTKLKEKADSVAKQIKARNTKAQKRGNSDAFKRK